MGEGFGIESSLLVGLGIVPPMRFRAWLSSSPWAKVACLALLALFVVLCGMHYAGAHFNGDGDGVGLLKSFSIVSLLLILLAAFWLSKVATITTDGRVFTLGTGWMPSNPPSFERTAIGAPLRR